MVLGTIIGVIIANFITMAILVKMILPQELIDAIKLYFQSGIDKLINSSAFDDYLILMDPETELDFPENNTQSSGITFTYTGP
jgi:hypothetical protein